MCHDYIMVQNKIPGRLASREAEQEHGSKEDCCQPSNRVLITKDSHCTHHGYYYDISDTTQIS